MAVDFNDLIIRSAATSTLIVPCRQRDASHLTTAPSR